MQWKKVLTVKIFQFLCVDTLDNIIKDRDLGSLIKGGLNYCHRLSQASLGLSLKIVYGLSTGYIQECMAMTLVTGLKVVLL